MEVIELPSLYDHQTDHKDRFRSALARVRRAILAANPGVGKTRMAKWIFGSSANRTPNTNQSGHSLFAVYGRPLVDNAVQSFNEDPALPHGVIMSGEDTSYGSRVQIASIDSLLSWFIQEGVYYPKLTFDLIAYDECHTHHPKFAKFLNYHDAKREALGLHPAYVAGLTATPQAKGLADVYGEIVLGPSTQWLIDNEFLSPYRYFRATEGKLGLLVKRGGEFTDQSVGAAMDGMSGDLVRDWKLFAEGRPTIGFFPLRAHAKAAMEELAAAGVRVEYVDGDTPDDERRRIFRWLDTYEIDYICNVKVVDRGTNIPAVSCIQVCTAVASVVRWRQMIGRGSRFDRVKYPRKTDCVVLDHGGCIKRRLGLFEDDPHWSLDITTKEPGEIGTRPTIECPKCHAIYRGGLCKNCGYEPTPRERRAQGLQFDGSELKEVKREEKKPRVATAEELMRDALFKAGKLGLTWRQAFRFFKQSCEKAGANYRVPRYVTIAGHQYRMLRYADHGDHGRKVGILFPIVNGQHGGDYLVEDQQPAGEPY